MQSSIRKPWLVMLGAVAFGCSDAGPPVAADPIDADALLSRIEVLADDSMRGRGAGTQGELLAANYLRAEFESMGLLPAVPDYLQHFSIGNLGESPDAGTMSQNVLATLPGRGALASEWVVVGAHYDHVGWREVAPDSVLIFNGADDNASGTSLMVELARFLSDYFSSGDGPTGDRRSIMFHAYGSEEVGLVGSRHFCAVPTVPLASVTAMVNLDMVGRLRLNGLTLVGTAASGFWSEIISDANSEGLSIQHDDKYIGGSDHKCFYDAGRPVAFFFTGIHAQYHTPEDDAWLIDGEGMVDVGELAARVLVELATRPDL